MYGAEVLDFEAQQVYYHMRWCHTLGFIYHSIQRVTLTLPEPGAISRSVSLLLPARNLTARRSFSAWLPST